MAPQPHPTVARKPAAQSSTHRTRLLPSPLLMSEGVLFGPTSVLRTAARSTRTGLQARRGHSAPANTQATTRRPTHTRRTQAPSGSLPSKSNRTSAQASTSRPGTSALLPRPELARAAGHRPCRQGYAGNGANYVVVGWTIGPLPVRVHKSEDVHSWTVRHGARTSTLSLALHTCRAGKHPKGFPSRPLNLAAPERPNHFRPAMAHL